MSLRAFASGCNIIAFEKENKKYGMCCAWSTMLDYDVVGMLLGSQSITGKKLEVGDIVGVSSLSVGQEEIANVFGSNHSDEVNKFKNIGITCKIPAILINNAKTRMVCKVTKIAHLIEGNDDNFVVLKVLKFEQEKTKEFLPLEAVIPE